MRKYPIATLIIFAAAYTVIVTKAFNEDLMPARSWELTIRPEITFDNRSTLTITLLLNGTVQQLRSMTKEQVVRSMWAITKIDLPLIKKLIIWEIIKENKTSQQLQRDTLQATGGFILSIPDTDLMNLNLTDWGIVDYLGTLRGLTRRQVGIVAYALKSQWGDSVITKVEYINRMKGILCGFPPPDLESISSMDLAHVSKEVFKNIGACTRRQKNILLAKFMSSSAFGPPQAWTTYHTEQLGLLISTMDKDVLPRIRPAAMEGILPDTIAAMTKEQLDRFTEAQIDYLSDLSLTAYRAVMGISSSYQENVAISYFLLVAVVILRLLVYP